jgi:hypothetical protein
MVKQATFSMAFTPVSKRFATRSVGHNVLYSSRKHNSFFLLDMSGDSGTWNIHTNHTSLRKALPYSFSSTSKQPNARCLISKFLSAWFLRQAVIPSGIHNKYFGHLRALLLQQ